MVKVAILTGEEYDGVRVGVGGGCGSDVDVACADCDLHSLVAFHTRTLLVKPCDL